MQEWEDGAKGYNFFATSDTVKEQLYGSALAKLLGAIGRPDYDQTESAE